MVRWKSLFFVIHSTQADRYLASRLVISEHDLRPSPRLVQLPAVEAGLQSGIISNGNAPLSKAAWHSASGGATSGRGHLAQGLTDAARPFLLGAIMVLFCFVAFGCYSFHGHRLIGSKGRKAPSTHREEWSIGNSRVLGPLGCENFFAGRAQLLVGEVSGVRGALNRKELSIEEGYCIIRSRHMQKYYLLWRDGMKDKAYAALNFAVATEFLPPANDVDSDSEDEEPVAPPDDTDVYDSLRQLGENIQGPITKFPNNSMNALVQGKQNRYIAVKPSCDSNPSMQWRNAKVNFFLTKREFEQGAEPHRSVRVSDILNVSWYCQIPGAEPQFVLTTNQQSVSFGSCSSDSFHVKEAYLGRQTQDATAQLQKDLLELSDLVKQIE